MTIYTQLRNLEKNHSDMKKDFDRIIEANTKLSDEKAIIAKDNRYLRLKIDKVLRYLEKNDKISKKDIKEILDDNFEKEEE